MSRELPPEEPAATTDSLRLAEVYDSPDRTIQEVAPRPLPPENHPKPGLHHNHSRPRFGPVMEVTIDKQVLSEAHRLAQDDLGRLVLRNDGTVIVANSAHHARLIKKNRNFS